MKIKNSELITKEVAPKEDGEEREDVEEREYSMYIGQLTYMHTHTHIHTHPGISLKIYVVDVATKTAKEPVVMRAETGWTVGGLKKEIAEVSDWRERKNLCIKAAAQRRLLRATSQYYMYV